MKIQVWPRVAGEPPAGVEVIDDDCFMVSLGEQERPFVLAHISCDNPECPCDDTNLVFIEFTPEAPGRGLRFDMSVDLEGWSETNPPSRQEEVAVLVEQFVREAPDSLKAALRLMRRLDRESARLMLQYRFSKEELEGEDLVPYMELIDSHGSITRGGSAHSYELTDGQRRFMIDDLYCADPDCTCEHATLAFYEMIVRDGRPGLEEPFLARVPFRGRRPALEGPRCLPQGDMRRLFGQLQAEHPGLVRTLEQRHRRVRALVARQLGREPPAPVRSPVRAIAPSGGRNAPCPCGSGKKYKRCCGR